MLREKEWNSFASLAFDRSSTLPTVGASHAKEIPPMRVEQSVSHMDTWQFTVGRTCRNGSLFDDKKKNSISDSQILLENEKRIFTSETPGIIHEVIRFRVGMC